MQWSELRKGEVRTSVLGLALYWKLCLFKSRNSLPNYSQKCGLWTVWVLMGGVWAAIMVML